MAVKMQGKSTEQDIIEVRIRNIFHNDNGSQPEVVLAI